MKKFGIVATYYGIKEPISETIRRLANAGIRDIELTFENCIPHILTPMPFARQARLLKSLRKTCNSHGINVRQLHGPYSGNPRLFEKSSGATQKSLDIYRYLIDCACELGVDAMVVHPVTQPFVRSKNMWKIALNKNAESILKLVEYIKKRPFKLAVENLGGKIIPGVARSFTSHPSDLKELVALTGSEHVGLCLDTGHANIAGWDIPAVIRSWGNDIAATHLHENEGTNDLHVFPFTIRQKFSNMDWFAIFRAFKDIGYPRPLIGECANSAGDLPPWLLDNYLKTQARLMERAWKQA